MTLRYTEVVGTDGNDSWITIGNIYFGLSGNDAFTAATGAEYVVVMGGEGSDTYTAASLIHSRRA